MDLDNFDWEGILTKAVAVVVILVVSWILARVVKWLISKQLGRLKVLQRQGGNGQTLGESLGTIGSLVVWLIGLMAILNLFAMNDAVAPIRSMLDDFLGAVPRVVGAGLLFFVGFMLAKIARQVVELALQTADVDNRLARLGGSFSSGSAGDGLTERMTGATRPVPATGDASVPATPPATTGGLQISRVVGMLVFAIILIVVSIASLQVLGIASISAPATEMLTLVLNSIPKILAAVVLLGLGVVIARFVAGLLQSTLEGLGTDATLQRSGLVPEGRSASAILTRVAQVAIVLFFAVAATRMLDFPELTNILNAVLALGGRVVFGALVIAAGVYIAGLLAGFASGQSAQIIRVVTIVLFVAMGLNFMGVADSIVNLAFGALVVGAALAAAIAFGLGGRDAAARQLQKLENRTNTPG